MNNDNKFKSILKEELYDYIKEKEKCGFYTNNNNFFYKLRYFDDYLVKNNINDKNITKDIIINWLSNRNIKQSTKSIYASIIRGFAAYLNNQGINAYILPLNSFERKNEFTPYIFSYDEIKRFINTSKEYYDNNDKNERFSMIFKLLYISGIRIGECLNIKIKDVNFLNNTILLRETKNGSDRYIAFNDKFKEDLLNFHNKHNINFNDDDYFFRKVYLEEKFKPGDIYIVFRRILFKAKIMRNETGPRLHDFRHTFAVHNLLKAEKEKKDINSYLPILSSYMGHKSVEATEKYLRLVSEAYSDLRNSLDEEYKDIMVVKEFKDEE